MRLQWRCGGRGSGSGPLELVSGGQHSWSLFWEQTAAPWRECALCMLDPLSSGWLALLLSTAAVGRDKVKVGEFPALHRGSGCVSHRVNRTVRESGKKARLLTG